jgi:hypothetical protein
MQFPGTFLGILLFTLAWMNTDALNKAGAWKPAVASARVGSLGSLPLNLRGGMDNSSNSNTTQTKQGSDPSGIWDLYRKIGGPEVDDDTDTVGYGLKEKKPCKWGKVSISFRLIVVDRISFTCYSTDAVPDAGICQQKDPA